MMKGFITSLLSWACLLLYLIFEEDLFTVMAVASIQVTSQLITESIRQGAGCSPTVRRHSLQQ